MSAKMWASNSFASWYFFWDEIKKYFSYSFIDIKVIKIIQNSLFNFYSDEVLGIKSVLRRPNMEYRNIIVFPVYWFINKEAPDQHFNHSLFINLFFFLF